MTDPEPHEPESLARQVGKDIAREAGVWLRWAVGGAAVGALLLGGAGLWYFGIAGLYWGAGLGAAIGGVGAWLFYLHATTL